MWLALISVVTRKKYVAGVKSSSSNSYIYIFKCLNIGGGCRISQVNSRYITHSMFSQRCSGGVDVCFPCEQSNQCTVQNNHNQIHSNHDQWVSIKLSNLSHQDIVLVLFWKINKKNKTWQYHALIKWKWNKRLIAQMQQSFPINPPNPFNTASLWTDYIACERSWASL